MSLRLLNFKVSCSLLLTILVFSSVYCQLPPHEFAPNVTIPLDQPVEVRLKDLHAKFASTYKKDFLDQMDLAKKRVGRFTFYVGKILINFYMNIKGDPILYDEFQSIADATGVDFEDIALFNFFYEASCTSIIARAGDGVTLLFGSNLDFDFAPFIRKYVYQGTFTKGGQTIFVGNGIYGSVGIYRGQRLNNADNFAISLNERDVERGNFLINMFFGTATNVSYFIRKILQLSTYEEALERILNEPLTTAAYYTIGGTYSKGGCIVERSANAVHSKNCLDQDNWFLVITNYDRDVPDPSDDRRRIPTEEKIKSNTQANFTPDYLETLMTTAPLKRLLTDPYLTITTVLCQNLEDPRSKSTWKMYLWNDVGSL